MPIEIKELIVRVVVDAPATPGTVQAAASEEDRAALIEACIEETLRVLRRARER